MIFTKMVITNLKKNTKISSPDSVGIKIEAHHITVASRVKEISGVQYPLAGSVASSQDKK